MKSRSNSEWYKLKEQSAGKLRLVFLWYCYKLLQLKGLKVIITIILPFIFLFSENARLASKEYRQVLAEFQKKHHLKIKRFSTFKHILNYAYSLADKMSVICDNKNPIRYTILQDKNWRSFQTCLKNKEGVFLISSHLGNVETFCGLSKESNNNPQIKVHALMEIHQNSIFHNFIKKRQTNSSFILHSTEKMNFQKIMELYENMLNGESMLMAGDRVSAENPNNFLYTKILDKNCRLPIGTFKFAKKMKHSTFVILLCKSSKYHYTVMVKQLNIANSIEDIAQDYGKYLEENIIKYPDQWYNFYHYFE